MMRNDTYLASEGNLKMQDNGVGTRCKTQAGLRGVVTMPNGSLK